MKIIEKKYNSLYFVNLGILFFVFVVCDILIGDYYTKYDFGIWYGYYACIVNFVVFFLKWCKSSKKLIKIIFLSGMAFMFNCVFIGVANVFVAPDYGSSLLLVFTGKSRHLLRQKDTLIKKAL